MCCFLKPVLLRRHRKSSTAFGAIIDNIYRLPDNIIQQNDNTILTYDNVCDTDFIYRACYAEIYLTEI